MFYNPWGIPPKPRSSWVKTPPTLRRSSLSRRLPHVFRYIPVSGCFLLLHLDGAKIWTGHSGIRAHLPCHTGKLLLLDSLSWLVLTFIGNSSLELDLNSVTLVRGTFLRVFSSMKRFFLGLMAPVPATYELHFTTLYIVYIMTLLIGMLYLNV
jgi:hypothetical protein